MAANKKLLVLPGDGIGPEVTVEAQRVLIRACIPCEQNPALVRDHRRERRRGTVGREIPLPRRVDARSAEVALAAGILRIEVGFEPLRPPLVLQPRADAMPETFSAEIRSEPGLLAHRASAPVALIF